MIALIICIPVCLVPSDAEYFASGYRFSYHGISKTLTISHGRLMANCTDLPKWTKDAEKVIFGSEVTEVDLWELVGFDYLREIEISDSTKVISHEGFGRFTAYAEVPEHWIGDGLYLGKRLVGYRDGAKAVEIAEGTTEISGYALSAISDSWASLTHVRIPESVKEIGICAFENQVRLEEIELPESLQVLDDKAFNKCKRLREISIPGSVAEVGKAAFHMCTGLKSVALCEGVQRLDSEAFSLCGSLSDINIPDSLTELGNRAFFNCRSLTSFTVPDTVEEMGSELFSECDSLVEITFGERERQLPYAMFYGCDSLTEINFGGVNGIGVSAFSECDALREVDLGPIMNSIGQSAFEGCDGLKRIVIRESVESIGVRAFAYCTSLSDITFRPATKVAVDEMFRGCTSINDLSFLEGCNRIGAYVFAECTSLTDEVLPANVKGIGDGTFLDCTNLRALSIRGRGTAMGNRLFAGCDSMRALLIPSRAVIRRNTFVDCNTLHVFVDGSEEDMKNNTTRFYLGETNGLHYDCDSMPVSKVYVDNGVGQFIDEKCDICDGIILRTQWYSDVPKDSWYHGAVVWAVENGIFNGMSATYFEPGGEMTRAMLVTVLWRAQGEPEVQGAHPFTDAKAGSWYDGALSWAYSVGITDGKSPTVFDPNGVITREQMATMLYRYSVYVGDDVTATAPLDTFPDADAVSVWALDAVRWSVGAGVVEGNNKGGVLYLDPQGRATRAQVATMLMRYEMKKNL